jgi:hypothetical protein
METFVQTHTGDLITLILGGFVVTSLIVLVPQLLRARQKTLELRHLEHMSALERGEAVPHIDERSVFAGRTAVLVPMVSLITAGTVTCFLIVYRSEIAFSMAIVVWCVAGVISLAAVTGGVALMGRLAQLNAEEHHEEEDKELVEQPAEH